MVGTTAKAIMSAEQRAAAPRRPIESNMYGNQKGPICRVSIFLSELLQVTMLKTYKAPDLSDQDECDTHIAGVV
jgi:hypothetical protein